MKRGIKVTSVVVLVILSFIFGMIFLVRGCLSAHDTFAKIDKAFYFNNSKQDVFVILKDHYNVTSYSSGGGMTNISGYSDYYLETREVSTLKLLKSTKFEEIDDYTKNCPHIIGCDDKTVWIFQDKIMAFDPYTHEKVCSKEKLEELNSVLKNNLPDEITYYTYNYILGRLEITTKDAQHYQISKSFKAQRIDESESNETLEITELKKLLEKVEADKKSQSSKADRKSMDIYFSLQDSIRKIESSIRQKEDEIEDNKDYNTKIQELRTKGFDYFYNVLGNGAIEDSTVYALLSDKNLKEFNGYFYFDFSYSDEVQRTLYKSEFSELEKNDGFNSRCKIKEWKPVSKTVSFLKGGFLTNKENHKILELSNPKSWLILTAKEVGDKSNLIFQRVNASGIVLWSKELPIKNFSDLICSPGYMILFSNDGEKITGNSESNYIFSINLKNGEFVMIDLGNEKI